jgi:hypothetical protein
MLTLDLTPITSRLDKIIELLSSYLTSTPTPTPPPPPIPTPIEEPPIDNNIITFENEEDFCDEKKVEEFLNKPPPYEEGWTTCLYNPSFEMEINNHHFIRHKETKELMTIHYDKQLYPYPHFEHAIFELNQYPKRMAYIVAQNFVPNPNNYKYITYKDGNPYNFKASNLEWNDTYNHQPRIGPNINQDIINDPSYKPITNIDDETFHNNLVFIYKGQVYQQIEFKNDNYYRICYETEGEYIVITDKHNQIGITIE